MSAARTPSWPYSNRIAFCRIMADPAKNPLVRKCINDKPIADSARELSEFLKKIDKVTYKDKESGQMVEANLSWNEYNITGDRLMNRWAYTKRNRSWMNTLHTHYTASSFAKTIEPLRRDSDTFEVDSESHLQEALDEESLLMVADNNEIAAAYIVFTKEKAAGRISSSSSLLSTNIVQTSKRKLSYDLPVDDIPENDATHPRARRKIIPTEKIRIAQFETNQIVPYSKRKRVSFNIEEPSSSSDKSTKPNRSSYQNTTKRVHPESMLSKSSTSPDILINAVKEEKTAQLKLQVEIEELKLRQAELKNQEEREIREFELKREMLATLRNSFLSIALQLSNN